MYKKLRLVILSIFLVISIMVLGGITVSADVGTYEYQIKVTQNGQPVQDVVVRLAGVGVEMTGVDGIATFDMSDVYGRGGGRQQLFRGQRYANSKGKASGSVMDEYDIIKVEITGSTFSYGSTIKIRLNELYTIDL